MWTWKVPLLAHVYVWGCKSFVRWETDDKLKPRTLRWIFIGYPQKYFGYFFYIPSENMVVVA